MSTEPEPTTVSVSVGSDDMQKKSLTPYEFFQSIGKPQYIVAPMVDHSDLSYRMLTRKYGADLAYTQMFSSNCFVQSAELRSQLFTTCPEDRPLIVQFCGNDPETLLKAARMVEDRCDAVDINLGCPQGIAKRGRYGAFLMEELELLTSIVKTLSTGLKIPVTCKTRIYRNDFERSVKLCETLVEAGASMLTIHGRSREEKGNLVADCDWVMIKRLKAHFGDRIPLIANGGIECLDDVHRCLEETGVDGVMTSEAILENPALFTRNLNEKKEYRTLVDLAGERSEVKKI
jgi:tRNA-dihydrouridine synthase 1